MALLLMMATIFRLQFSGMEEESDRRCCWATCVGVVGLDALSLGLQALVTARLGLSAYIKIRGNLAITLMWCTSTLISSAEVLCSRGSSFARVSSTFKRSEFVALWIALLIHPRPLAKLMGMVGYGVIRSVVVRHFLHVPREDPTLLWSICLGGSLLTCVLWYRRDCLVAGPVMSTGTERPLKDKVEPDEGSSAGVEVSPSSQVLEPRGLVPEGQLLEPMVYTAFVRSKLGERPLRICHDRPVPRWSCRSTS